MKRHYWFVVLFVVWALASAWWYLYGVKGVKTDPQFFSPSASLISIIEILVMLLVACLLGYSIAWGMREGVIDEQTEIREKLASDNSKLLHAGNELKGQMEMFRNKYQQDVSFIQKKVHEVSLERDRLQQQVQQLENSASSKQENSLTAQARLEQLETEAGTLRYRIRQLEFQNKEHEESYAKLKNELESIHSSKKETASFSEHPFVRPVEPDEKDNLTAIKGIGPFIEKRLNMLGIYTFKQLSELTPELVDRVGNAIEFFPGRIERENWIGQAKNFAKL
jgi:predicted flap endonuclease-1-like 5' DNA nuclease